MGFKSWYDSQHGGVQAAFVAGLLAVIGAIITGVFALVNTIVSKSSQGPANSTSTATPASSHAGNPPTSTSPTASANCVKRLRITSPAEGTKIANGDDGVLVQGTACDLKEQSGWLFDLDSADHYYYGDFATITPTPVVQLSQNGRWQFMDSPIGDSGDQNKLYTLTIVLASQSCDKMLRAEHPIDGDYKLSLFPAGCQIADQVNVYVTYP